MTHRRKTIRDAIVTILSDAEIVAAGKVFSNRSLPIWESELPIINVYMPDEDAELIVVTGNKLLRNMPVSVELIAEDATDETIDDTLDGFAESIESAMGEDFTLGAGVIDSQLTRTEIATDSSGDKRTGTLRLTYSVKYTTS